MCCEHAVPVPKSSVPISRETLRVLKAQTEEKRRVGLVNELVTQTYNTVIGYAATNEETSYAWNIIQNGNNRAQYYNQPIPPFNQPVRPSARAERVQRGGHFNPEQEKYTFICDNLPDIIQGLQSLFPDCSIEHKMMARSPDGKMYDVSNMDAAAKAFIGSSQIQEVILIDWS
jgi:hypothetical protein